MKRFSIVQNGYDVNEVNRFIDVVIGRLEKISNENNNYVKEINNLKEELNSPNNVNNDERITKAILAVQDATDRMKNLAKEEANMIIDEAKRNANSIVHEALVTAEKTENEANLLRKNITIYKSRLKSQSETLLELIEDMDKEDL